MVMKKWKLENIEIVDLKDNFSYSANMGKRIKKKKNM